MYSGWKHQTLLECCKQNFQWVFSECIGDSYSDGETTEFDPCADPLPQRTEKWYYPGDEMKCVKDCVGEPHCDDRPESYEDLYDSFHICCEIHLSWSLHCEAYDATGLAIAEEPCSDTYWDTESNELVSSSSIYYADCKSSVIFEDTCYFSSNRLYHNHHPLHSHS